MYIVYVYIVKLFVFWALIICTQIFLQINYH